MRFRARLSLASAVLILASVASTGYLANRRFQDVFTQEAARAVDTAQAFFDQLVESKHTFLDASLRTLRQDSRVRAGFADPSKSFLQAQGGSSALADQQNYFESWLDELAETANADLLLMVNRDLKLSFGLEGKKELADDVLQSRQVQALLKEVGETNAELMLWSGPRLRKEADSLSGMSKGLYLAGVATFSRDPDPGHQDRMLLGAGIIALSDLPFDNISATGADAVFIDKDQVLFQTFSRGGLDAPAAQVRAEAARKWLVDAPADAPLSPVLLNGAPYWAKPLLLQKMVPGPVRAGLFYSRDKEFATSLSTRNAVLQLSAVMFVLGLALALYQVRDLSRPILELAAAAEQVGAAKLDVVVSATRRDELGDLARQFNSMVVGLKERELAKDALGKYLSPDMAREVMAKGQSSLLHGERRELTVLFSDVAGFTTLSEKLQPEQVVSFLNQYLDRMVPILFRSKAYVDKFEGDAIMAFWNAPVLVPNHAAIACLAALEMKEAFDVFAKEWSAKGYPGLAVRWGLNTGEVVVGNMGSSEKVNYTAIGDEVNLASRLEGTNKFYGTQLIAGEATVELARSVAEFRELDQIRVKGKKSAVRIYEILAPLGKLTPEQTALRTQYEAGLQAYRAKEFTLARDHFQRAMDLSPTDGPSREMIRRAALYLAQPPPSDWDGVFTMTEK